MELVMDAKKWLGTGLVLLSLMSCGGGGDDSDSGGTPPPPSANIAPTANAGDDQTINEQTIVTLSGSGTDSDGSIASYVWTQTAGTSVTLTNANSASATFTAPDISADETLTFKLTVTDNDGATHSALIDIYVLAKTITVKGMIGRLPIANAEVSFTLASTLDTFASSVSNDIGEYEINIDADILPPNDLIIITATHPDNGIDIRSLISVQTLKNSIAEYSSNLTVVSEYTEAAILKGEANSVKDYANFLSGILKSDENEKHIDTLDEQTNALADYISDMVYSSEVNNPSVYRANLFAKTIEILWPVRLTPEVITTISFPYKLMAEMPIVDVFDVNGAEATLSENGSLNVTPQKVASGYVKLSISAQDIAPFILNQGFSIAGIQETKSKELLKGSTEAISVGTFTLTPQEGSFVENTNITISKLAYVDTGNTRETYEIHSDITPQQPVFLSIKLKEGETKERIRLVHIDDESKDITYLRPDSYDEATNSAIFIVNSFSLFDIELAPDEVVMLGRTLTVKDFEDTPEELFNFIEHEILDVLSNEKNISKILQSWIGSEYKCSANNKDFCITYVRALASKALVSFMRISENKDAFERLNKVSFDGFYGFFELNGRDEYLRIYNQVIDLSLMLSSDIGGGFFPPISQYSYLTTVDYEILGGSSSNVYPSMIAYRLSKIGQLTTEQIYSKLKSDIQLENIYSNSISQTCDIAEEIVDSNIQFEYLRSPIVPVFTTNDQSEYWNGAIDQTIEDGIAFYKGEAYNALMSDVEAGFPVEIFSAIFKLPVIGAVLGGVNNLITDVSMTKHAFEYFENGANIYGDQHKLTTLYKYLGSTCKEQCLGSTVKSAWRQTTINGKKFFISPETLAAVTELEGWKTKFSNCNFINSVPSRDISDSGNNQGGIIIAPDTPSEPFQAVQINAELTITGTAKVGNTLNLDASGSSVSSTTHNLSYQWKLYKPSGSSTSISNSTAAKPTLYIDKAGAYTLNLTVSGGGVEVSKHMSINAHFDGVQAVNGREKGYLLGNKDNYAYGAKKWTKVWTFEIDTNVEDLNIWMGRKNRGDDNLALAIEKNEWPTTKCTQTSGGSEICGFDDYLQKDDGKGNLFLDNPTPGTYYLMAYALESFEANNIWFDKDFNYDHDEDGVPNNIDWAPYDYNEAYDSDGDNIGDNQDAFPNDPAASVDQDNDGQPDSWHSGYDETSSVTNLVVDSAPGVYSINQNAGTVIVNGKLIILAIGGEGASFQISSQPTHGEVTLEEGKWLYTPESGFEGEDSFSYLVTEPNGEVLAVIVQLTISEAIVDHSPSIISVDFPSSIVVDSLNDIRVEFKDPDGDINLVTFDVIEATASFDSFEFNPMNTLVQGDVFEGSFTSDILCLSVQSVELQVTIFDGAGNRSSPQNFSFDCVDEVPPPVITSGKLNDTGITWGGNYSSGNNSDCSSDIASPQDCNTGRDAQAAAGLLAKVGGGVAGFDFTKLDSSGNTLDASATQWSCVKDNHTGLVWEVKTTNGTIHDTNNIYRWGGKTAQGLNHANKEGTYYDDWNELVDGSNNENLCGFSDWRVPTVQELTSITNKGTYNPAIDSNYFPNSQLDEYWSSSPFGSSDGRAWSVGFRYGYDTDQYRRSNDFSLRLVRSVQ